MTPQNRRSFLCSLGSERGMAGMASMALKVPGFWGGSGGAYLSVLNPNGGGGLPLVNSAICA